ncbi:hypothetical protein [Kitasatospora sp. NPDC093806]|uniref:hypothetical protein n=1 Tax=Kitasatospora sp. NPDC093806 TaxID=3155075 RepID=UPI003422D7A0
MNARNLAALALGDFRDRVRRPVYAVTLLAAVGLGCLAVPPAGGRWAIVAVGEYRGLYNSAYTGVATALAAALWITVGGFYVVRKGIGRDTDTGVGQILAATPLRSAGYLAGRFLSNLLVLASMLAVLAGTTLVLQLVRGEDRAVDPVALLGPFLTLALPVVAVTAGAAVFFETVRPLRGGGGNVVWFLLALAFCIGGQAGGGPFDGLGVHEVSGSMDAALTGVTGGAPHRPFSLGLTKVDAPLIPFQWDGLRLSGGFLCGRLVLVLLAVGLAVLPALWFGRFDPARSSGSVNGGVGATGSGQQDVPTAPAGPAPVVLPATAPERGRGIGRLVAGEVRILLGGVSRWWWLGAAALGAAAAVLPIGLVTGLVLPALWLWPVLLWSRLGSRQAEHGLDGLLGACPAPRLRLLAEWASGLVLTVLLGLVPLVRELLAGDVRGAACWAAGALFIPALAMFLGYLSRSHRPFQALYLPLWYLVANHVAAVDFMGAVRVAGRPAGPGPLVVAALALAMLLAVVLLGAARRGTRD